MAKSFGRGATSPMVAGPICGKFFLPQHLFGAPASSSAAANRKSSLAALPALLPALLLALLLALARRMRARIQVRRVEMEVVGDAGAEAEVVAARLMAQ